MLNPQACQALAQKAQRLNFTFQTELPPAEAWRLMLNQDILYGQTSPQLARGVLPGFLQVVYDDNSWQEAPLEFKFPFSWRLQRWQHNQQYLAWHCECTPQRRGSQIQLRFESLLKAPEQRAWEIRLRQWEKQFQAHLELIHTTQREATGSEWMSLDRDPLAPPQAQVLSKAVEQALLLGEHLSAAQLQALSSRSVNDCYAYLESGVWQNIWQARWFTFSGHARTLPLSQVRHGVQSLAWPDPQRLSLEQLHLLFVLKPQQAQAYVPVPALRQQLWLWPRSRRELPIDKPLRWRVPGSNLQGVFQRQPGGESQRTLVLKSGTPRKLGMNLPGRLELRNPGGGLACFQMWQPKALNEDSAAQALTRARSVPYLMQSWPENERLSLENSCVVLLGFPARLAIESLQDWLFEQSVGRGFVLLERGETGALLVFPSAREALVLIEQLWQVLAELGGRAQAVLDMGPCQFFLYEHKLRGLGQPIRQANQWLEECPPGHILLSAQILKNKALQTWLHQQAWQLHEMPESRHAAGLFQLLPPRK